MPFRRLAPLLWIVLWIALAECALELRAWRKGWPTLLFGAPASEARQDSESGPRPDFPFRSKLVDAERTDGAVRVWFASSSYAEDTQQRPEGVFPNLVGELLNARGMRIEVLNASASGHTVAGNTADLARLGARYGTQVVVLYQMSNDIDKLSTILCGRGWRSKAERTSDPRSSDQQTALLAAPTEASALTRAIESTTIYKHVKSELSARVARERVLHDSLGDEGDRLFELRVRDLVATVRKLGAAPVLCTFPTAHTPGTLDSVAPQLELSLLRFNVFLSVRGWLVSVERFNQVLRRVAASEDVLLVELAQPLGGEARLFRDMWHLTAQGHAEVAARIAEALAGAEPLSKGKPR